MPWLTKILMWLAIAAIIILAILLPVTIVTGFFGGHPAAGTIALLGLILLAFGAAWYVRSDGGAR